jgi:hypothetical protein
MKPEDPVEIAEQVVELSTAELELVGGGGVVVSE